MADRITSTRNPKVVEARKLDQRKHRREQGRFVVEGLQLLHMALDAGYAPSQVFYCPGMFAGPEAPSLLESALAGGAEVLEASETVLEALSSREAPQGLVATFALWDTSPTRLPLEAGGLVLVVDRLQDPGNLGTLIRTADAVGAAGVALITPCVDPFDPKTVRATMGSLFNVLLAQAEDVPALFSLLHGHGYTSIGADAHLGAPWGGDLWHGPTALVLGNEARGLSEDVRAQVRAWANLPMVGRAESLNVAIAGGVMMYAWLRANLGDGPGR
jgi:TrmH family RNA methyltransferase